jgi:FlaG/FlaF family flagellin (archaellin)
MNKKKSGLSPVIATMLLVAIVIVIALIVFLWFRGITEEAITKFDGKNIRLVCEEVSFDASYSDGTVYVMNTGNVPIYEMKAKIQGDGEFATETLSSGWPERGLNQGEASAISITGAAIKITLIPVLIGETSSGEKKYTCDERNGYEVYAA